jgi:hypothetical protein
MAVKRVVAGVDHGAGEPAAIRAHRGIEYFFGRLDPVDLTRRLTPKALGVPQRAGMDLVIAAVVLDIHGVASRAFMADHRLFFPFRDTPTLIWIKKKEGIFCTARAFVAFQSVNTGPVAENLTMTKAVLQPPAKSPRAGTRRWYNWLHRRAVHKGPHAAVPIPDRSIRP